ncbi:glycosyltransferase [Paraburkholderia susongensis]|uniref:Glycosyltransferase, GT2 family n=1 Tax=Paraburkholderia susongensis TaxID=1515439 RepID=A0A1X7LSQ8_9BURK|nr:glycosyltransferase [Paraburkholderia susongensis]SMG56524.1 Glycosyltransferase, GT2 family [Paraburkholderia susongensis]
MMPALPFDKVIVSLTTIASREQSLRETVASLVEQETKYPYEVRIHVSRDAYLLDTGFACEPTWVSSLSLGSKCTGINVVFTPNTGPYRKLLPVLEEAFSTGSDPVIVTCDDDTIYPDDWLDRIIDVYLTCRCIVAYRGHTIALTESGDFAPYTRWITEPKPLLSLRNLPTGKDGVLYRASMFNTAVHDIEVAMKYAPTSDDLWFRWHTIGSFIPCRIINTQNDKFRSTTSFQDEVSLWERFNSSGGNDKAVTALEEIFAQRTGEANISRLRAVIAEASRLSKIDGVEAYAPNTAYIDQALNTAKRERSFERLFNAPDGLRRISAETYEFLQIGLGLSLQRRGIPAKALPYRKLIMGVKTWNRVDYVREFVETFISTRNPRYDWTLIIADDGSTDGTLEYLRNLQSPVPIRVIENQSAYACGQFNSINDVAVELGFDVCFHADDDIIFVKPGWDDLYLNAMERSGFQHLVYKNHEQHLELTRRQRDANFQLPPEQIDASGTCSSIVDAESCGGAFYTVTPEVLNRVGYADEINFPIRGQWHIDFTMRCVRAGFNGSAHLYDARGSNDYITSWESREGYRCSLPWNDQYKKTKNEAELARRWAVVREPHRIYVPQRTSKRKVNGHASPGLPRGFIHLNDVFDRVYVINLKRRPDRLAAFSRQARALGIEFVAFEAVDGSRADLARTYADYVAGGVVKPDGERQIQFSRQFYLDRSFTEADRVAYLERNGKKAVASQGARGYLETYIAILKHALGNGYERVMIFDDDALFHRDFVVRFSVTASRLPADWRVFMLGAMQFNWDPTWVKFVGDDLYHCMGSSVASHAVGLTRPAMEELLQHSLRRDMPLDIGALSYLQREHAHECFVAYPNLVIQESTESDINTSSHLDEGNHKSNRFRWTLEDFEWTKQLIEQ